MTFKLPKAIRPEEFPKLMKATRKTNKEARTAFILAYGSGLRISEVKNLTIECIRDNSIMIYRGKGEKDRVVPKPKGWKEWMKEVLPIKKTVRSLERNFKTAAKKAKLNTKYSFHSLRHGFATRSIEKGIPLNQIQVLLGHSNISTTSIYTRANPKDALKSYTELY